MCVVSIVGAISNPPSSPPLRPGSEVTTLSRHTPPLRPVFAHRDFCEARKRERPAGDDLRGPRGRHLQGPKGRVDIGRHDKAGGKDAQCRSAQDTGTRAHGEVTLLLPCRPGTGLRDVESVAKERELCCPQLAIAPLAGAAGFGAGNGPPAATSEGWCQAAVFPHARGLAVASAEHRGECHRVGRTGASGLAKCQMSALLGGRELTPPASDMFPQPPASPALPTLLLLRPGTLRVWSPSLSPPSRCFGAK